MQYWLMKSEPGAYSFGDLEREGKTLWDGVRNYQARNNMMKMRKGDHVLIYHSVSEKALVGVAEVTREHYPDPTTNDPDTKWVVVDLVPVKRLKRPVELSEIKDNPKLAEIPLIKQSRLSVMPLEKKDFDELVRMGNA